jgi:hypothetical protein
MSAFIRIRVGRSACTRRVAALGLRNAPPDPRATPLLQPRRPISRRQKPSGHSILSTAR